MKPRNWFKISKVLILFRKSFAFDLYFYTEKRFFYLTLLHKQLFSIVRSLVDCSAGYRMVFLRISYTSQGPRGWVFS